MAVQMKEIVIYCDDVKAQTAYYRDVLGLALEWEDDGLAHFDAGGGFHMLLEDHAGERPAPLPCFYVEDVEGVRAELNARGADLPEIVDEGWGTIIRFTDPEGNRLAIEHPHEQH